MEKNRDFLALMICGVISFILVLAKINLSENLLFFKRFLIFVIVHHGLYLFYLKYKR